ncbi:4-hydroxy-3-methylbut-2-enyl diphosphate reductase [Thermodesulfovibrio yellowstonii]|uniref:4-hydroxy-3-methylbut-2-enyl diphosphate reductase n=2 Tax=Thermodesulfovibrio yellowstonii TaxID=28262 RepID=A0A9W6GF57_9BACT|nr:4-hydroxy-3-methylbut-2-enyl diphosphate reductase [Thermodesulfovibrio islandicus]
MISCIIKNSMQKNIVLVEGAGFCFGVKRAIDIAFDVARKHKDGVFTLGPIIHNPQVVERLKDLGVYPVDEILQNTIKTLIIRAHGIPKEKFNELKKLGCEIIDATCPFVKKAQNLAEKLASEGYQVLIIGDREHPEVKGIFSYAGEKAIVINHADNKLKEAKKIPIFNKKIGIIQQTTQPMSKVKEIMNKIINSLNEFEEIRIFNTLCNFTSRRLEATEKVAKEVDVMIVVGGKNSANTTQLANLCKKIGVKTYHIEDAQEIDKKWVNSAKKIGVTAGASTPQWIIDEVIDKIKKFTN